MEVAQFDTSLTALRTEGKPSNPVILTDAAIGALRDAMTQQKLDTLRIGVVPGGCSGFSYDLELVSETKPTDIQFEQGGVKMALDPMSASYLKGVRIDFVTGLKGSGFKFENPNAQSSCGCGSSFSA